MEKDFNLINLNVGGKKITTYYDTLKQSSYFQKLIENNEAQQALVVEQGNDQVFFIDRDADVFEEIMHYLRSFEIRFDTPEDLEKLKIEATFFDLKDLVLKVEHTLRNIYDASDEGTYHLETPDYDAKNIKMNFWGSIPDKAKQIMGKICYVDVNGNRKVDLIVKAVDEN